MRGQSGKSDSATSGVAPVPGATHVYSDCRTLDPAAFDVDWTRAVVYADVPYFGDGSRKITGYGHPFPREEQIPVINRWAATGALVMVSECVPMGQYFDGDWWEVDITHTRQGQKRTFGGTREWVTMNRPPVYVAPPPLPPCEQVGFAW